jgi:hypothetical protein
MVPLMRRDCAEGQVQPPRGKGGGSRLRMASRRRAIRGSAGRGRVHPCGPVPEEPPADAERPVRAAVRVRGKELRSAGGRVLPEKPHSVRRHLADLGEHEIGQGPESGAVRLPQRGLQHPLAAALSDEDDVVHPGVSGVLVRMADRTTKGGDAPGSCEVDLERGGNHFDAEAQPRQERRRGAARPDAPLRIRVRPPARLRHHGGPQERADNAPCRLQLRAGGRRRSSSRRRRWSARKSRGAAAVRRGR